MYLNIWIFMENNAIKIRLDVVCTSRQFYHHEHHQRIIPCDLKGLALTTYPNLKETFDLSSSSIVASMFNYVSLVPEINKAKLPTVRSIKFTSDEYNQESVGTEEEYHAYADNESIDDLLLTPAITFDNRKYKFVSLVYTLSTVPHVALLWLMSLNIYLDAIKHQLIGMQFRKDSFIDLQKAQLNHSLTSYFKNEKLAIFIKTINYIMALTNVYGVYRPTYQAVVTLSAACREQKKSFTFYLENRRKISLFWPEIAKVMLNPEANTVDKLSAIRAFAAAFPSADLVIKREELHHIFTSINLSAKYQFYDKCINLAQKKIKRVNFFPFPFAQVILQASFTLNQEYIFIDLKHNDAYQRYLQNTSCPDFKDALQKLFEPCRIVYHYLPDKACITFDKRTSQRLRKEGLHFNVSYLKSMLQVHKNWQFFQKKSSKNTDLFTITGLPNDVLIEIFKYLYPSFDEQALVAIAKMEQLNVQLLANSM